MLAALKISDGRRFHVSQMQGKVALVTGAAQGIGRAAALAFAEEGARVVVADIQVGKGDETVSLIQKAGGAAIFVKTDVVVESEVQALISKTVATYGRLDFAANNAGIEGDFVPAADVPIEMWNRVIDIDLTGVFLCMKHEIQQMLKQGGGAIVNVSSMMAQVCTPTTTSYSAAKAGVIGITHAAALAYAKKNIRVNAICPGNTRTDILDRYSKTNPIEYKALLDATPIGRLFEPREMADVIVWLCSDKASAVTGHALVADGAFSIQ
jgi:NAD(P)-dependent dehydrogenase (short-subunit alcohol dehydrogenase family)